MKRLAEAAALLSLSLGCAGRSALTAQPSPADPELHRIEAGADSGRVAEARTDLERWFAEHGSEADRRSLARARFLRARLSQDADSARSEYLWIAIDGGSEYGAPAWLRLAQLDLVRGDPPRARRDLERLRADYPASDLVAESWYWTGVAAETQGDLEGACAAWERSVQDAAARGDPEAERRSGEALAVCVEGTLRLTVQIGAFREAATAELVRKQAADAGFVARVSRADGLNKVRVGSFGTAEAARQAADRLKALGFSAIVVASEDEGL